MNNVQTTDLPNANVNLGLQGTVRNIVSKMTAEYNDLNTQLTQDRERETLLQAESTVKSADSSVKGAFAEMTTEMVSVGAAILGTLGGMMHIGATQKDEMKPLDDKIEHSNRLLDGDGAGFTDRSNVDEHKLKREIAEAKDAKERVLQAAKSKNAALQMVLGSVNGVIGGSGKAMNASYNGVGQIQQTDARLASDAAGEQKNVSDSQNQILNQMYQVNPVVVAGAAIRG